MDMFKNCNSFYTSASVPDISFEEFTNWFQLYSFNLTSNKEFKNGELPLCLKGTAKLRMTFSEAKPLTERPQSMYMLALFPSMLEMTDKGVFDTSYRSAA